MEAEEKSPLNSGANEPRSMSEAPREARPSPWTLWNLLVFLSSAILAFVAANFLTVAGYMLVTPRAAWKWGPDGLGSGATFTAVALMTVFHALLLGLMYLFLVVNHGLPFWQGLAWRKISLRVALACLAAGVALAVLIQFVPPLLPTTQDFPLRKMFSSPGAGLAIAAFAILVAPLVEELLFRGLLFAFFEKMLGVPMAVAGTALLFASLHVSQYWGAWNHIALLALVGLCFSAVRGATGSVTPAYVMHLAYNSALIAGLAWQTRFFTAFPASGGP